MRHLLNLIVGVASIVTIGFYGTFNASAQRIHSPADTLRVNKLISELAEPGGKASNKSLAVAEALVGTPFSETTMTDSLGTVEVNLSEFDDIDFLNAVVALSRTLTSSNPRWREYANNLREISRRRGEDKGIVTKMIYGSDWIVDNVYRGNVKELTEYDNNPTFKTKSLEYVSRHRPDYKALADSAVYEDMKMVEMGFRTHKIPYMKKEWASKPVVIEDMRDGDIIMLLAQEPDKDVFLTGIVKMHPDGPYLIYASKEDGKIVEAVEPLARQIRRNTKKIYGWRWLRIAD